MVKTAGFHRLPNTGLFTWNYLPGGATPPRAFFVFHGAETVTVATLADAFSQSGNGRFAVVPQHWWPQLQAVDAILKNTRTDALHFFDDKGAAAILPLHDPSESWSSGFLSFSFKGGLTAQLNATATALQFVSKSGNPVTFLRGKNAAGAARLIDALELAPDNEPLGLRAIIALDASCMGLGPHGYERTISPVIEYEKRGKRSQSLRAPIFTLASDVPTPSGDFGMARLFLNPIKLLFDPSPGADDFSKIDLHALKAVPSAFASVSGARFFMESTGLPTGARLVFTNSSANNLAPANLSLDGFMRLTAPAGGTAPLFLTGDQSTEYFKLDTRQNAQAYFLEFVAGQPATYDESAGDTLTDHRTTSWVRLVCLPSAEVRRWVAGNAPGTQLLSAAQPLEYVRQPEAAPLFKGQASTADRFAFVDFAKAVNPPAFPMIPRGQLTDKQLAFAKDLEQAAVGPKRRSVIDTATRAAQPAHALMTNGPVQRFRTPHGIVVEQRDGQWIAVIFAMDEAAEIRIDRPAGTPRWLLQDALEKPNVFLVIPSLATPSLQALGTLSTPSIGVSGWGFGFRLDEAIPSSIDNKTQPFFLLKLVAPGLSTKEDSAMSLMQLARDQSYWALADTLYPVEKKALQEALIAQLSELSQASGDVFDPARARIIDPHWNGVSCLSLRPNGFPDQAAGIRMGITNHEQQFLAKYLFVDTTPVAMQGTDMQLGKSVISALIDYDGKGVAGNDVRDQQHHEGGNGDKHSCVVRSLQLLIADSRIAKFTSTVDFGVAKFLGGDIGGTPAGNSGTITLVGRYERVITESGAIDRYTFSYDSDQVLSLAFDANFPVMKQATISRAVLTSSVEPATGGHPKRVKSTLSLDGELKFKDCDGLLTIDALGFSGANLNLNFNLDASGWSGLDIGFNAGAFRFDIPTITDGVLSKWPLKLRGLLWSGRSKQSEPASADLLTRFGFFPIIRGPGDLDFGLDFDIDFGRLGSLAGSASKLLGAIAFGWTWPKMAGDKTQFAVGFKFRGADGKLEIGIQNIFRLLADNVSMKTSGLPDNIQALLRLTNARLEVIGRPIPDSKGLDVAIFVPKRDPTQIAWLVSRNDVGTVAGLTIHSFAIGQEVTSGPTQSTTKAIVDAWAHAATNPDDPLGGSVVYAPDAGWAIALGTSLGGFADVDLAMVDSAGAGGVYGLRVKVPGGKAKAAGPITFDIDVLYRRISDHVGEYSAEIGLPVRQLDFGAITVTLPNIGLDVFTNGDWEFDAGMPRGQDYSRSGNVQVFPFIGFGGFLIGERSGQTLAFAPQDATWWDPARDSYSPILEFGVAGRVGLGKEVSKGPLRAGASITVYSAFHGVFGTYAPLPPHSNPCPEKAYEKHWRLAGNFGLMFEAYGYVDFGIIKAAAAARAWAEAGLVLEPGAPIVLSVELRVEVAVEVVIAEIDIPFDGSFQIRIHLSFSAVLHEEYSLGRLPQMGAMGLLAPRAQYSFDVPPNLDTVPPITMVISAAISGNFPLAGGPLRPKIVTALAVPLDGVAHGEVKTALPGSRDALIELGTQLMKWLLKPGLDPKKETTYTREALNELDTFLNAAHPQWSDLTAFVGAVAFTVDLRGLLSHQTGQRLTDQPGKPQTLSAVGFPWLPGLGLRWAERHDDYSEQASGPLRPQADATMLTPAYLAKLQAYFEAAYEQYLHSPEARYPLTGASQFQPSEQLMVEWVVAILKQLSGRLCHWMRDAPSVQVTWEEIRNKLRDTSAGPCDIEAAMQGASRLMTSGLRLPGVDTTSNITQAELLGLSFAPPAVAGDRFYIEPTWAASEGLGGHIRCTPGDWWWTMLRMQRLADASAVMPADIVANSDLLRVAIAPAIALVNRAEPLGRPRRLTRGGSQYAVFHPFTTALLDPTLVDKEAKVYWVDNAATFVTSVKPTDKSWVDFRWCSHLDVAIRRIPEGNGAFQPSLYEVVGITLETRNRLEAVLKAVDAGNLTLEAAALLPDTVATNDGKTTEYPAMVSMVPLAGWDLLAVCTNLSPETFPPSIRLLTGATPFEPVASLATDWARFLAVLYRQGLTNDTGYYIREISGRSLESLFTPGSANARLTIAVSAMPASMPGQMPAFANGVYVSAASAQLKPHMIEFASDDTRRAVTAGIPGSMVVMVERRMPAENQAFGLSSRFHLLDYEVSGDASIARDQVFPALPSETGNDASPPNTWHYKLAIPYTNFFKKTNSRYSGIGKTLRLNLGIRDVFGNLLPSEHLSNGKLIHMIGYDDPLIRLRDLPGLSVFFAPRPNKGARQGENFVLTLHVAGYSTKDYTPDRVIEIDETIRLIEVAQDQYSQPEIAMSLVTLGVKVVNADHGALQRMVMQCLGDWRDALAQLRDHVRDGTPYAFDDKDSTFTATVSSAFSSAEEHGFILPVTATLRIERTDHVDPDSEKLEPRVRAVDVPALPGILGDDGITYSSPSTDSDWSKLESAFQLGIDASMRLARSVDSEAAGAAGSPLQSSPLWLVNPAIARLEQRPVSRAAQYAPRPLSTSLVTGRDDTTGLVHQFDADLTAYRLLAMAESALGPAVLNRVLRQQGTEATQGYARLLSAKSRIARAYATRVLPILTTDTAASDAVQQRWRAVIAADLRTAYEVSTSATLEFMPIASAAPGWARYAAVGDVSYRANDSNGTRLGMLKIVMPESGNVSPTGDIMCTELDITPDTPTEMSVEIKFIEQTLKESTSPDAPRVTRWYKLLSPITPAARTYQLHALQRRVPKTPVIVSHGALAPQGDTIASLTRWTYRCTTRVFDFLPARDSLILEVKVYRGRPAIQAFATHENLVDVLATFLSRADDIEKSLATQPDFNMVNEVAYHLDAFVQALEGRVAALSANDPDVIRSRFDSVGDASHWKIGPAPNGASDIVYTSEPWNVAENQAVLPTMQVWSNAGIADIRPDFVMTSPRVSTPREAAPNHQLIVRGLDQQSATNTVPTAEPFIRQYAAALCDGLKPDARVELELHAKLATKLNFSEPITASVAPSQDNGWGMHPLAIQRAVVSQTYPIQRAVDDFLADVAAKLAAHVAEPSAARYLCFDILLKSVEGQAPFNRSHSLVEVRNTYAREHG